jgi:hypothetical protein
LSPQSNSGAQFAPTSRLKTITDDTLNFRLSGHAAAAPPINEINSRRRIASPEAQDEISYRLKLAHWKGQV